MDLGEIKIHVTEDGCLCAAAGGDDSSYAGPAAKKPRLDDSHPQVETLRHVRQPKRIVVVVVSPFAGQLLSFNQLKTPCDPIPSFLTLKADSDPRFVISDPKLL